MLLPGKSKAPFDLHFGVIMNHRLRAFLIILFQLALLVPLVTVQAIPVLPSSFYGIVKHNGENFADGTLVEALMNDQVVATGNIRIYQDDSVFSLDVPGDNTDTQAQDGGQDGDTIHFRIGGLPAQETGIWHSGTNTHLDLSVTASLAVVIPQPTNTPIPTQTAIIVERSPATPIPTNTTKPAIQDTPESTASLQPESIVAPEKMTTENKGAIPDVAPTDDQETALQPTGLATEQTITENGPSTNPESSSPAKNWMFIGITVVIVLGLIGIWWFFLKK